MLIPNYWSDVRRRRLRNSSLRPVYRAHRPLVKEKLRSVIPTVSSLLVDVIERDQYFDPEIAVTRSMEGRIRGIPERSRMIEPLSLRYQPDGINSNSFTSCSTSHQTEDISVREDENGIRSHLCPLDKIQDSDKEDNEAEPDKPMKFDFDIDEMIKGCNLKSDEIPYLQAERPPLSDSDENTSSDVDASTAMIYAPLYNPTSITTSESLQYFPIHEVKMCRGRELDEKTMARWNEDSSDDNEYYTSDEREQLLLGKSSIGDESDMEEFMETPEIKSINCEKSQSSHGENNTAKNRYETMMDQNELTGSKKDETSKEEYSQLISDNDKINESHSEESDNKAFKEGTRHSKKEEEPTEHIETNDSDSPDDNKKSKLLKSDPVVTLPDMIAEDSYTKEIRKLFDSMLDNVSKDLSMKNNDSLKLGVHSAKNSNFFTTENSATVLGGNEIVPAVMAVNVTTEYKEMKHNDLETNVSAKEEDKNREVSSQYETLPQTDREIKDKTGEKKNDLGEPTASTMQKISKDEETQPDLATALRFMTEVYHSKDDEELYSDTLSMTDLSAEVAMAEKSEGAVTAQNYQPNTQTQETADRPSSNVSIKSPNKSSAFEPVITEEQRTVTRPRNKFSKFIKSFKRRLVKKA